MKILWWLFIYLALHIVVQDVHADSIEIYVSILDTVVMNCRSELNSQKAAFSWKQGNKVISMDSELAPAFQNDRFQIMVDENSGVCSLTILNITTDDLGQYICKTQVESKISSTYYTLKLTEFTSTTMNRIISTQDNISTGAIRDYVSATADKTETATENPHLVMSTDSSDNRDIKNETPSETGITFRDKLYYSLSGVGLVLVLCLSILCNLCINKKCKTVVTKTTENCQLNTHVNHIEDFPDLEILEDGMEVYSSQYETINECEMLPKHVLAMMTDTTNKPKQSSSASDVLYLEIIEDDVQQKINQTGAPGNPTNTLPLKTQFDSKPEKVLHAQVGNTLDSDLSTNIGLHIDDYLHPYATLNANKMEYLSSYSALTNVDQPSVLKTYTTNKPKQSSSAKKLNETGTPGNPKNTLSLEFQFDSKPEKVPHTQVGNITESGGSSDSGSSTDGYLHPYTTLNTNDMGYLSSYSALISVDKPSVFGICN